VTGGSGDENDKQQTDDDNLESHESMLRGCVGLDMTAFALMILYRMLHLLEQQQQSSNATTSATSLSSLLSNDDDLARLELVALSNFIREHILGQQHKLQLLGRLEGTLASEPMAQETANK
jgi:hypothetical protein